MLSCGTFDARRRWRVLRRLPTTSKPSTSGWPSARRGISSGAPSTFARTAPPRSSRPELCSNPTPDPESGPARYTGQDEEQEDPLHVPEISRMSSDDYEAYCAMPTDDDESLAGCTQNAGWAQAAAAAAPPAQPLEATPQGLLRWRGSPPTAAAPHSLMRALVTAAQQLGADSAGCASRILAPGPTRARSP